MRPLKLTLTAFGPYHETEVIDFEALKPYDLFVISGNTGAGKTSIFDGISYALFGGASGEDRREPIFLRSDFAPDHLPTTAELIFTLRGKTYRVFRQLPYIKAGNKSQTPGKAELYEIDQDNHDLFAEISVVDRQITSEVDRKIFELMGLNKAQFNQLVMLPQGEYQRFLTSSTNDKEAILRTVFNTERYQTLIHHLKIRRDTQNDKVINLSAAQTQLIYALFTQLPPRDSLLFSYQKAEDGSQKSKQPLINPHQALNGLALEAAHYEQYLAQSADEIQLKTASIQTLQTTIAKTESINQAFIQLETAEETLKTHLQSEADIQSARKKIELSEQAQPIEQSFEAVTRLRGEAKEALTTLKNSESQLKAYQTAAKNAQQQYALEVAKESQKLALSKEIVMLESNQERVESLAKLQAEHQALTMSLTTVNTQLTAQKAELTAKIEAKELQVSKLEVTENLAMPAFSLTKLLQQLTELKTVLMTQNDQKQALSSAIAKVTDDQVAAEKAQALFDQAYQAWLANQAQLLAQSLQQGDHCPVCGSTEHPALNHQAENSADNRTLTSDAKQQAFTQAQKIAIAANAQYQQSQLQLTQLTKEIEKHQPLILNKLTEVKTFLENEAILLTSFQFPEISSDITLSELEAFLQTVNNAGNIANQNYQAAAKQREQLKSAETALIQLREAFEKQQESRHQIEKALTSKTAEIQSITAMIPAALQDTLTFQKNLQLKKTALTALNNAFEAAQSAKTASDQKLAVFTHQVKHEKSQVETLVNAGKEARKTLDHALITAGFTQKDSEGHLIAHEEAFIAARLNTTETRQLRETVSQYEKQLEVLKQQIMALKETLKDQTMTDLTQLREALQTKEIALTALNETVIAAKHSLKIIQQAILKIGENRTQLDTATEHLQKIVEVHDLLRGDNTQKLSFERFILIAYFEQVIEAANLRLQKMTNGQFEFTRSENLASHGRQSGLDLDIYDAYTGEARDVKTLSGGEKFKTSLSLSLGMADAIQAHQGGISIDTLFIDEGFGSLDEESLLQALDVLIELQNSGKMIGVISHVEELKQTLPARIQVTKTKGGFSKTEIITQDSQ